MFDPYYTWLGIPPKDQPPDHYRVLGLNRFEADRDVISNAADRQMAHVRNVGCHREQEQAAILSRLSTARVCLLDDAKRQQYDRMLLESSRIGQAKAYARPPMPGPTKLDPGAIPVAKPVDSQPPMPGPTKLDPGAVEGVQRILTNVFALLILAAVAIITVIHLVGPITEQEEEPAAMDAEWEREMEILAQEALEAEREWKQQLEVIEQETDASPQPLLPAEKPDWEREWEREWAQKREQAVERDREREQGRERAQEWAELDELLDAMFPDNVLRPDNMLPHTTP